MFQRKSKSYFGRPPKIYLTTPKPKKTIKIPWSLFKTIFLLIITALLSYLLFFSPYFVIQNIDVRGTKNENAKSLAQSVRGKNLWLFNKKDLGEQLLKFAEIRSVSIRRWPPKTLKIKINEKAEGIIWQTEGRQHLLDNQGIVIKEVTESSLPKVIDSKNAPLEVGKQVVTPSFVNFIKNLSLKFTPKTGLPLKEITIPAETTFEIIVQTEPFKVIFDTQGDLDQQLENMTRVYQMKRDEIKEYMDLRIEGRVYYK